MNYPKMQGLYKRYREGDKKGKFIIGEYSIPEFKLLKDIEWEWTEKIDGTCISVNWLGHPLIQEIEFKGKTDRAEIPTHLLEKLKRSFIKEHMIEMFGIGEDKPDVELKGEGFGYKIQNGCKYFNGEKLVDFILFDIKIGGIWLKREIVYGIAKQMGMVYVPVIGYGTIDEAIKLVKSGMKSTFGDFIAEGLVLRAKEGLRDRMGRRIITKIKHKDFN